MAWTSGLDKDEIRQIAHELKFNRAELKQIAWELESSGAEIKQMETHLNHWNIVRYDEMSVKQN